VGARSSNSSVGGTQRRTGKEAKKQKKNKQKKKNEGKKKKKKKKTIRNENGERIMHPDEWNSNNTLNPGNSARQHAIGEFL
jgi:hypothetical protein